MIKIKYLSDDVLHQTEMVCYANSNNKIFIEIQDPDDEYRNNHIVLSRETAIRLAKDLRREISFLE